MVSLGGQLVTPDSVIPAVGWTEGLIRINLRVPASLASGNAIPVTVSAGGIQSPAGPTLVIGP
jgi:uncharacterized protein (TIGR03437 family)